MWLKARTTPTQFAQAITTAITVAVSLVVGGVVLLTVTGRLSTQERRVSCGQQHRVLEHRQRGLIHLGLIYGMLANTRHGVDIFHTECCNVTLCSSCLMFCVASSGKMTPWTGRFWTLLDPTYAKKYIPIIASVSEHQPTTWSTYVFDVHMLVFTAPAGFYYSFKHLRDSQLFLLTFALAAIYFSGIMIR